MADEEADAPGTATAPQVIGQGCVQRFDPEALGEEDGTEFEGAEALWQRFQREQQRSDK
ncbi:hypothetical protein [Pseudomonas sp. PA15(2017)]|uniref:hypothetical protein n=1 Tax=Pseudomonas sp. PA15(2017) TaxID=1932111 RepID=UPI000B1EEB71|nr:hypothetical protein [Pseudomonas sp. PA15(2017)]